MSGSQRKLSWLQRTTKAFRKPDADGEGGSLRPFRLLSQDVGTLRRRYISDWTVFNQLVFASAVYVFFTNLLPGITFAADLYQRTGQNWGAVEVVFSIGLCGVTHSLLAVQPLNILGVTGPFSVLAENIYSLCHDSFNIPFLPFMAWSLIHSGWMHVLLAIFNAHDWTMMYVTEFSCEIFSLLNSIIYFHKAVQIMELAHAELDFAAFLYAVIGATGTFILALFLSYAERWEPLFHRYVRMGLREYAAAISIIFFIGMPYVGELKHLDKGTLHTSSKRFEPSLPGRTHFYVEFWHLPIGWVFAAIVPGAIITILFYFDHEISSIICTVKRYGIKKPTGYAIDIALLGMTTALCGILGIPPANGLLPQAPLHSESLLHDAVVHDENGEVVYTEVKDEEGNEGRSPLMERTVYEQRYSNFLHAGAILVFIAPPLQLVLGLTPTSVLAGLFLFMGEQSLSVNPILKRTFWMLTPPSECPPLPEGIKSYWPIHAYTLFEIIMTVVVFIVTLTVAGPAFPVIIIALVPFRLLAMNKIWSRAVLRYVDKWACREGYPEDGGDAADAAEDGAPVLPVAVDATASSADAAEKGGNTRAASSGMDLGASTSEEEKRRRRIRLPFSEALGRWRKSAKDS